MTAAFEIVAFAIAAFIAVAGALGMTTTMSMFRSGIFLMASFIGVAALFILLSADLIGVLQVMMYIGGMLVMILFMVLVMHDPGGAMMAGMDMPLLERWFSKGLVPRHPAPDGDCGKAHGEKENGPGSEKPHGGHAMAHRQHGHGTTAEAHSDADPHARPHKAGSGHEHHAMHGEGGHDGGKQGGEDMDDMDMDGMDMSMVSPVRPAAAWIAAAIGLVLVGLLVLRPAWPHVEARPDPDSARRVGHLLMEKYMVAFEGAGFLILIGIFGAVLLARPSTYPDDPSRSAKVAIDEKPEPITDDGLIPLAGPPEPPGSLHRSEGHA